MKHLKPINIKAQRIGESVTAAIDAATTAAGEIDDDVVGAAAGTAAARPDGCTLSFSPGWEVDSSGGTAGLCQPVERDIYDCYVTCFWPVQVPDHVNYSPDWASNCAAATKDWRSLDLVFP